MNFLADESVDRPIVDRLRRAGYRVDYVAEMEPGMSDDTVLERASRAGALLPTADKDFGELVFRLRRLAAGVLLFRLAGLSTQAKADHVAGAIGHHATELQDAFTVVAPGFIRIRRRGA